MSDDDKARARREELRRRYEEYADDHADITQALWDHAGSLTGTYPDGYLEELREDWDE